MSMKYRQRGYRESDRDTRDRPKSPPAKPLTPEERAQRRALKHAVDRQAAEVVRCPNCGRNVQQMGGISLDTRCPHCAAMLHACRACRHFDTGARWECRAPITERVADKAKANACSHFEARVVLDATGKRTNSPASNDPKAAFESLFKR
jgi:hypothetical protein